MNVAILTRITEKGSIFNYCENRRCTNNNSYTSYSNQHTKDLGWIQRELPTDEAMIFGKKFIILCPVCSKEKENETI